MTCHHSVPLSIHKYINTGACTTSTVIMRMSSKTNFQSIATTTYTFVLLIFPFLSSNTFTFSVFQIIHYVSKCLYYTQHIQARISMICNISFSITVPVAMSTTVEIMAMMIPVMALFQVKGHHISELDA